MYSIVTLAELREWLNIKEKSLDDFLASLQTSITNLVENYTQHHFITREFTELRDGHGERALLLKNYPVYLELDSSDNPSNVTLYDDTEREWGSDVLVAASDYFIDPDTGRLILYNDEWNFSTGVSCIKVIYRAGYSRFNVVAGINDYLDVKENSGSEVSVQIPEKRPVPTRWPGYDAESLAAAIQTALNDASGLNGAYSVSYNHSTQKFTISVTGGGVTKLSLLWNSGSNSSKSIGELIGFSTVEDDAKDATTSYTADDAVTGLPDDLRLAAQQIALKLWEDSKKGIGIQNVKREVLQQGINREWVKDWLPITAVGILERYKRIVF